MSNGLAVQHNTLSDIQIAHMNGFIQDSPLLNVLFWLFVVGIIFYFFWARRTKF